MTLASQIPLSSFWFLCLTIMSHLSYSYSLDYFNISMNGVTCVLKTFSPWGPVDSTVEPCCVGRLYLSWNGKSWQCNSSRCSKLKVRLPGIVNAIRWKGNYSHRECIFGKCKFGNPNLYTQISNGKLFIFTNIAVIWLENT